MSTNDKLSQEIRVRHFILIMWLKDKHQKLEGSILRDKLGLDVMSVDCAADCRGRLMARIKLASKRRSYEILKALMGENAFKASKQPVSMELPVLDYNRCVQSNEQKIQGVSGIEIFPNSKERKNDFKEYANMIDQIKMKTLAGEYLGEWVHAEYLPEQRNTPTYNRSESLSTNTLEQLASKKHPFLVDQLFDPAILNEIEKWEEAEQRLKEAEDDDEFEPAREGVVYWAETPLLPGILKNGGSRYDGNTRVLQLYTAGVPMRYVCRFEKRFPDWKLFEGAIHEYFKDLRVFKGKEFFKYSVEEAIKLTDQIDGLVLFSDDEKERWNRALAKVTKRLTKNRTAWARKQAKRARDVLYDGKIGNSRQRVSEDEILQARHDERIKVMKELCFMTEVVDY